MRRKIYILFFIIIILGLITSCSDKEDEEQDISAIVSNLNVIEKGKEEPDKYWIIAFYPDKYKPIEKMKIFVKDKNVWNLIEINRTYTAHYAKDTSGVFNLYTIERLN
ncbi:hypothetical protein [Paenibacillus agilis]|uniref:Uncharacterized protein n=1 Tax=Paenibacillus agilis TaxID=3020863 RepID=A0A559IKH2_9BACL|nr:hypothetical protein [Paenibacillus agilis]TVX88165.1 hypothetical protein FPZ44_19865 [Paenibacillus agilis]